MKGDTMAEINENNALLNRGLEAEYTAIAAYETAIASGKLNEKAVDLANTFKKQHNDHAEAIKGFVQQLGGQPVEKKSSQEYISKLPADKLTSQENILRIAAHLEKMATIGFLKQVSELNDRKMAQTISSISSDEAMHWATLRNALGEAPVPFSFVPLNFEEAPD